MLLSNSPSQDYFHPHDQTRERTRFMCNTKICTSLFATGKGLNLYQVLAPNAFSYVDGYISAINRNVHSLVHERVSLYMFHL